MMKFCNVFNGTIANQIWMPKEYIALKNLIKIQQKLSNKISKNISHIKNSNLQSYFLQFFLLLPSCQKQKFTCWFLIKTCHFSTSTSQSFIKAPPPLHLHVDKTKSNKSRGSPLPPFITSVVHIEIPKIAVCLFHLSTAVPFVKSLFAIYCIV